MLRILTLGLGLFGAAAALGSAIPDRAQAQGSTVDRTAKGPSAKSFQVGVYLNVQADCTSGTLPALRMISPPANGTLSIKRGKVSATHYKQCLALEVPGFIAFYRSKADFTGTDTVTIEVKYPQGRTEVQRIRIDVDGAQAPAAPAGQKI